MLALEERPFKFGDIVGQKGILQEMRNRSREIDFPEVMIFEGVSGSGKTSLALIVAALLNDPAPIVEEDGTQNPNPESESSRAIRAEKFSRDVRFYDASSMNKEEMQKLEGVISSAPMFDRKRVLIIDEAQEMTNAGKGVALRLLEKKRRNSHIILCTMDINRFDKAVQSRGQLYKFRAPGSTEIAELLFRITQRWDTEDEIPDVFIQQGLFTIAESCGGNVRAAIQSLERCLYGKFFTEEEIAREFGLVSSSKLTAQVHRLLDQDTSVYSELVESDLKSFFFRVLRMLVDAEVFRATGYIDQEWKLESTRRIAKHPALPKLLERFQAISLEPYFREVRLQYELAKFFQNIPEGVTSAPSTPRRGKRVPLRG